MITISIYASPQGQPILVGAVQSVNVLFFEVELMRGVLERVRIDRCKLSGVFSETKIPKMESQLIPLHLLIREEEGEPGGCKTISYDEITNVWITGSNMAYTTSDYFIIDRCNFKADNKETS